MRSEHPWVVVALVAMVGLAGCAALGLGGPERMGDESELTPVAVPDDGPAIVPGVERTSVRQPEQLAAAHRTRLDSTTYSLERTRRVTTTSGEVLNSVRFGVTAADGGSVYNASRVEVSTRRFPSADAYSRIDAWSNSSAFYGRFVDENGIEGTWFAQGSENTGGLSDLTQSSFVGAVFTAFDAWAVGEGVEDGDLRYRFESDTVVDTDALPGPLLTEQVTNGSLVASVGSGGVVHSIVVSYDARYRGIPVHVELCLTVTGVGATTPQQPQWVDSLTSSPP